MQRRVPAMTHVPQARRARRAGAAHADTDASASATSRSSRAECVHRVARQKVEHLRVAAM
jgi:hypothetical protein